MEGRFLRLCSAFLLMAMLLAVCIGAVCSPAAEKATEASPACSHTAGSGTVEIYRISDGKSVRYTLQCSTSSRSGALPGGTVGQLLRYELENLPYGDYILTVNDTFCCRFRLSPAQPRASITLP